MAEANAMGNLFQNKLFLQYLAGAGQDIGSGNAVGTNVNKITQQNISSQNYMKMLQKMLGKGLEFKSDAEGKATMSGDLSKMMELGDVGGEVNAGIGGMGASTPQSTGAPNPLNPSSSPAMSGADLAGLSPEMISQALQFKFGQDQAAQKKITDTVDMDYKRALIGQTRATTAAATPSITLPGTDIKLTNKQYIDWYKSANKDERTAAIKNFEYAQSSKGGNFKGSFEQFQDNAKTTHMKDFQSAVADGYTGKFNEWMLEMTKAGGINLGDYRAKAEIKADVDTEKWFKDPKGLSQGVEKYINSEEVQSQIFQAGISSNFDPEVTARATNKIKIQYIRRMITSTGAVFVGDPRAENGVMSWDIKWPDGREETVKYDFGT